MTRQSSIEAQAGPLLVPSNVCDRRGKGDGANDKSTANAVSTMTWCWLYDDVTVSDADQDSLSVAGSPHVDVAGVPTDASNIAVRALAKRLDVVMGSARRWVGRAFEAQQARERAATAGRSAAARSAIRPTIGTWTRLRSPTRPTDYPRSKSPRAVPRTSSSPVTWNRFVRIGPPERVLGTVTHCYTLLHVVVRACPARRRTHRSWVRRRRFLQNLRLKSAASCLGFLWRRLDVSTVEAPRWSVPQRRCEPPRMGYLICGQPTVVAHVRCIRPSGR